MTEYVQDLQHQKTPPKVRIPQPPKQMRKPNEAIQPHSEIEGIDVLEDVHDNSDPNLEHGHSSAGDALEDIADAPPEKDVQLELNKLLVYWFPDMIEELARRECGVNVNLDMARDMLKNEFLRISNDNLRASSPQLSLAIPDELANLNEEKEHLLQEMLETIQKTNGIIKNYRELFSDRLNEEIEERWNEEEYERNPKEERGGNRYSFPTFLANYLLFAAIMLIFILPAIVFQILEHPNESRRLCFIDVIVSWLNSTRQPVTE